MMKKIRVLSLAMVLIFGCVLLSGCQIEFTASMGGAGGGGASQENVQDQVISDSAGAAGGTGGGMIANGDGTIISGVVSGDGTIISGVVSGDGTIINGAVSGDGNGGTASFGGGVDVSGGGDDPAGNDDPGTGDLSHALVQGKQVGWWVAFTPCGSNGEQLREIWTFDSGCGCSYRSAVMTQENGGWQVKSYGSEYVASFYFENGQMYVEIGPDLTGPYEVTVNADTMTLHYFDYDGNEVTTVFSAFDGPGEPTP